VSPHRVDQLDDFVLTLAFVADVGHRILASQNPGHQRDGVHATEPTDIERMPSKGGRQSLSRREDETRLTLPHQLLSERRLALTALALTRQESLSGEQLAAASDEGVVGLFGNLADGKT
jgi:hypothetical protein